MEALLTVVVPSYNSEAYLDRALASFKDSGPGLDVVIVDDGSTDGTAALAQGYVDERPELFRLIRQENGGHGAAVNTGIAAAKGRFFRVLDSDDWLAPAALQVLLEKIAHFVRTEVLCDLIVCNYVYEYSSNASQRVVRYRNAFVEEGVPYGWAQLQPLREDQFFAMHSLVYRTEVLRASGLMLPRHCFYVDNVYNYIPLPWVHRLCWLDIDLYHYFIGREDQSVHTPIMIERIDQQLLVTQTMVEAYHLEQMELLPQKRAYMYKYLAIVIVISQIHLLLSKTKENQAKIKDMWQMIEKHDARMAKTLKRRFLVRLTNLPTPLGRWISRKGFYTVQKYFKFS